jgi:hypothetical protein
MLSCLMVTLLCAICGAAQSGSRPPSPSPSTTAPSDIRQDNFLDFTYPSSLCAREFGKQGIGKTVRVHEGEYKNKNVYFTVDANKILYGDLTGDGRDDAIVPASCGAVTANFERTEVYIYTIRDGRTTLVGEISDRELERDYRKYFPDTETYWGVTESGLKVSGGNLEIEVLADGPHAAPQHTATLQYHLTGKAFRPLAKPERRDASQ